MKRQFTLIAVMVFAALTVNAQFYGSGNSKVGGGSSKRAYSSGLTAEKPSSSRSSSSSWECAAYGIGYSANFDYADKGALGIALYGFPGSDKHVGMAIQYNGIYSLASEKFFDDFKGCLGPNFYTALSDEVVLFAPLCLTVSSMSSESSKLSWGAALIPSIGLKLGKLFLSAGWNVEYNFSAKQDNFNTETFHISLGFIN